MRGVAQTKIGAPCVHCHTTAKYRSNGKCVQCTKADSITQAQLKKRQRLDLKRIKLGEAW